MRLYWRWVLTFAQLYTGWLDVYGVSIRGDWRESARIATVIYRTCRSIRRED